MRRLAWILSSLLVVASAACSAEGGAVDSAEAHVEATTAASNIPLFQDQSIVSMRLEAPLQELFDKMPKPVADEYAPGGFAVPDVTGLSTTGKIIYTDAKGAHTVPVTITMRGNTSLFELPFKKLTLDVAKADAKGTIFEHAKKIKLGTHGGETDELTPLGRRIDQESTHREAFAYRLLETVGIKTLKTRPAVMTYVDTGRTRRVAEGELVRKAFFLEDSDDAAQRYGGTEIKEAGGLNELEGFDDLEIARIGFAESLIGNADWQLDRELYNMKAIQLPNKKVTFAAYDFDLAATVTTSNPEGVASFFPDRSPAFRNVAALLNKLRVNGYAKKTIDQAFASLLAKKGAAVAALAAAELAPADKAFIGTYIESFFEAAAPKAFYLPHTVGPVSIYKDAALKNQLVPEGADAEDVIAAAFGCGEPLQVLELSPDKKAVHVKFLFGPFAGADSGWTETENVIGATGKIPAEVKHCWQPGFD